MIYDIVIIGGGPSGSNLARLIDKNKYKVLVIEKRNMNELDYIKNKVCGGLLSDDSQKILAKLNISIPKDILVNNQYFYVEAMDLDNELEAKYDKRYLNMDREKFDRYLFSLIPNNVDKHCNVICKNIYEEDDYIVLKYKYKGENLIVKTRILVGADGANSIVRKKFFNEVRKPKQYISIQEWYENKEKFNKLCAIFSEEVTDFYSWLIPKDEFLILGSAIEKNSNVNEKFNILKKKLEKKGINLGETVKSEGTYIERPLNNSSIIFNKRNVYLIGEASGSISPSSADGISFALKSSISLANKLNGMKNSSNLLIRIDIFLKNLKSKLVYNKFIRKIIIKSGIFSID